MKPGFSERTFEFCFNAEYCRLNAALLASHPYIPSQAAEKDLGYDVEFRIRTGGFTQAIYIQHKVSAFAEFRSGKGAPFWDHRGGPYFRFPIDNDQHNTLCDLSLRKGNVFYCAPTFNARTNLETHFRNDDVGNRSILFDPMDVGRIHDADRHNITYDPAGGTPTLHSDPIRFERVYRGGKEDSPELKRTPINEDYVADLSETLIRSTEDSRFRSMLDDIRHRRPIEAAQMILGRIYKVSWMLLQ